MKPTLEKRLREELRPGETLAWSGAPKPSAVAAQGIVPGLIGLAWVGAGAGLYDVYLTHAGSFVLEWIAIGLGLVGVVMVSAPLRLGWRASRTAYALTASRAIVVELEGKGAVITSFGRAALGTIRRHENADGSGG